MTEEEYAEYVEYLRNEDDDFTRIDCKLLHAVIGIAGEAGELIDIIKKVAVYNQPLNIEHLKEEAGDLLHYFQMLCNSQRWSLKDVMQANVDKLKIRYPNGYTHEDAKIKRDKE